MTDQLKFSSAGRVGSDKEIEWSQKVEMICDKLAIDYWKLISTTRKQPYPMIRQIIMAKATEQLTLQAAGKLFGKDHSTALHAQRKCKEFAEMNDKKYLEWFDPITQVLTQYQRANVEYFGSSYQDLFNHFQKTHGLILVNAEIEEIIFLVNEYNRVKQLNQNQDELSEAI